MTLRSISLISRRFFALAASAAVFVMIAASGVAGAQSQQSNAISRGFAASGQDIVQGALVSTKADNSSTVELATVESAGRLAGIVSKTALVELSGATTNETQVILSGIALGLVSDINGEIRAGDKITASPIEGVGMLADSDAQIVGTAQSDYKPTDSQSKTIKDKSGKDHAVHIGTVPLHIGISYYVAPTSQFVPPFLQSIANTIAGRPVSFMRILLSCVLLLLAFGSIFVLIYTSVRSGIISLGRNPLAANAIQRGLVGVIVIVLLVAAVALLGVYLILTT
jgi:hypothetical protein